MKWLWRAVVWSMVAAGAAVLLAALVVVTHSVESRPVSAEAAVVLGSPTAHREAETAKAHRG